MDDAKPLDLTTDGLAGLEKSLGLPEGFVGALRQADDWSFVIKAHAVVEAALSELLAHAIGRNELRQLLADIPVGGRFGKLAFCDALSLVNKGPSERFIRALGSMRNDFVHQIANVDMTFERYFSSIPNDRVREYAQDLDIIFGHDDEVEVHGQRMRLVDLFRANAKLLIATSLGSVLVLLHTRTVVAMDTTEFRKHADQLLNEMVRKHLTSVWRP